MANENGTTVLELTLPSSALARNLQTNHAAAPWFLVCFAYWFARATGTDPTLRLRVEGEAPTDANHLRHYRRAWIALEALEHALGDRLQVVGAPVERWPSAPIMNAPQVARSTTPSEGGGREHHVEVQFTADASIAENFSAMFEPIDHFRRQLPLGLFDGVVSNPTRWTPGNGAQADLWATSPDASVFHLFELKVKGNAQVGVLPELLGYLWLLHRARVGVDEKRVVGGGGPGVDAARQAVRLKGWIVAPHFHPLLLSDQASPLEWLVGGLGGRVDLAMAQFLETNQGFDAWVRAWAWPS